MGIAHAACSRADRPPGLSTLSRTRHIPPSAVARRTHAWSSDAPSCVSPRIAYAPRAALVKTRRLLRLLLGLLCRQLVDVGLGRVEVAAVTVRIDERIVRRIGGALLHATGQIERRAVLGQENVTRQGPQFRKRGIEVLQQVRILRI